MAARKNKLTLNDDWKEKIRAGVMLDRLLKHFQGEVELSSTQLKAADIILRKIVPDLARTEVQPLNEQGEPSNGFTLNVNLVKRDS